VLPRRKNLVKSLPISAKGTDWFSVRHGRRDLLCRKDGDGGKRKIEKEDNAFELRTRVLKGNYSQVRKRGGR